MVIDPEQARAAIERACGYRFKDPLHVVRALTHASVAEQRLDSNERMEFLGDSVLGLVVSQRIYERFPGLLEGEMTKIKSTAVSRQTCATIARRLGLEQWLVLGKGMQRENGMPQSLAAAVLESVIAAVYLDGGYSAAEAFVAPLFEPLIERAANSGHQENFKSVLQQHAQQNGMETPGYRVLDEKGPDHAKAFKVAVEIGVRRFGASWGQSKKQAEQLAALCALEELGLVEKSEDGSVRVVRPGQTPAAVAEALKAPSKPAPASKAGGVKKVKVEAEVAAPAVKPKRKPRVAAPKRKKKSSKA
jgi:ribonuclease-3